MDTLNTPRLTLIPISLDHCTDQYVSWLNDPEVYQYLETRGEYSREMLKDFLEKATEGGIWMWGIHIIDTGKHIGNIKIDPINRKHGLGEYGILMGEKSEWGKGFAKEASKAVIDYCFGPALNLRKITLGVVNENAAAVILYKKLGFKQEGLYRQHVIYDGRCYDILRMALFNSKIVVNEGLK